MIGYLKGRILENSDGKLMITIGTSDLASGVGYLVHVPLTANYDSLKTGEATELFVHTHVREDVLDLYGFRTRAEKDLFLTLQEVNGIGPKGALGILSKIEPSVLVQAIFEGDRETLTRIPGIGKKTAERVVLELADKIRKKMEKGGPMPTASGATSASIPNASKTILKDARDALVGLGYREQDIELLLNRVLSQSEQPAPSRAEDLIRTALRHLAQ